MTLLAFIALQPLLVAQAPETPPAPVAALPVAGPSPNPEAVPPLAEPVPPPEPVTELPATHIQQIEAINLFPNQGEVTSGSSLNDQRFGYVLHGEARAAYESNLFIQAQSAQKDLIFTITPGVAVGWGEFKSELFSPDNFRHRFERWVGKNYFYVDYSPSYTWYADHGSLDSFDQAARIAAEWNVKRLTLGVRGAYVSQTAPVEDIGNRVRLKELTGSLTARYDYSGKTSFEVSGYYDGISYDSIGVGSREWRNQDWMNYQISPKIKLGIGATVAHVERDFGAAQNYEQGLLRAFYEASAKLTLSLTGGAEWRQTDGGDDRSNGIFELDVAWSPFDGTYLFVQGYRRSVTGSTDASDYFIATGVVAQLRQRLYQRFYFDLTVQYQNSDYQDSGAVGGQARSDNLFVIRPGVGFDLASWVNCEISGEFRRNQSSDDQRKFDATTAMVRFNLLF